MLKIQTEDSFVFFFAQRLESPFKTDCKVCRCAAFAMSLGFSKIGVVRAFIAMLVLVMYS